MSVPLPIPNNFKFSYFFLPCRIQSKIFRYDVIVKSSDSMMDVKTEIAEHAREYYKRPITPYHFVMGQIDKRDFTLV